ncbi:MAG: preprotein translocase subunit SecA [Spirochaetales bacterium]|nr:preprotein translocase subunit SecA [Spirochaetales bacterium]
MAQNIMTLFLGSKKERDLKEMIPLVRQIGSLEPQMLALRTEEFAQKTESFRQGLRDGAQLDDLLPEAFALVREAARRVLGERIYDVQLMGGIALHRGKIMEMKTGEGKTLSSVTAAYLNALPGRGVHIVTVNDYLAERDAAWMGRVHRLLGVSVGVVLSNMDNEARKEAYAQDITYGTNNELGFDYLRDNMRWDAAGKVQRGHNYCIVDEIDSILIDEARTPLIISGAAEDDTAKYYEADRIVDSLVECPRDPETGEYPEEAMMLRMEKTADHGDYRVDEKNKRISFTDQGMNRIDELLNKRGLIHGSLFDSENFEYLHYCTQALRAKRLFRKDVDYVVSEGKVEIVDEFTGRILHGRRYSEGLHQAIEAKERIKVAQRNRTLATITFQNYFRMYDKLSGMTGTAETEATEFTKIYNLEVVVIPTNRPVIRKDADDVIYLTEDQKFKAIVEEIRELNRRGQPVLVGTISIEKSERLSRMLTSAGIRHEVLNAKNHAREASIIAEAGAEGAATIATNMAGRGTDIKLGGNPEHRASRKAGSEPDGDQYEKLLAAETERWWKDYETVRAAGGLHVLGTERHDSRRIDNQLRGRSGRQGDPGSSRFYISLDDDLMRLFGGENLKGLMGRMGMQDGEPIFHPWVNKAIERAQKRVEERNFEIRKHLLEYDDVLNEQRKFIYDKRNEILADGRLERRLLATAEDILDSYLEDYRDQPGEDGLRLAILLGRLKETLGYTPPEEAQDLDNLGPAQLKERILNDLEADLNDKSAEIGKENLNLFIRFEYLRQIDTRWQDHLESLEALREAVYLRAYGQKNPLLEYKLEGFQIFDAMLDEIRTGIARKVFQVRVRAVEPRERRRENFGDARHVLLGQFGGPARQAAAPVGAAAGAPAAGGAMGGRPAAPLRPVSGERGEASPQSSQIRRTYPKVGRNDPCPCGSGKKYKYCHGR